MTTPKEYHNIQLKNITLTYLLERKPVKNINLRIKSDGSVCVSANNRVPVWRIEDFIIEKQDYIERAIPGVFEEEYAGVSIKTICGRRNLRLSGEKPVLKSQRAETSG